MTAEPDGEALEGTLREAWEEHARQWIAWARRPGHDSYWQFHRDAFLPSLPPPPRRALDDGCGEGRLTRDLRRLGYEVIGIDGSSTLIDAARELDPDGDYRVADAAALPLPDASVDLVVAFLSWQDVDDLDGAAREAARVLVPGGSLRTAIVHPMNSGGKFAARTDDAEFVIRQSYFEERRYVDTIQRDGLEMTFASAHRSLQRFTGAILEAGLLIDRIAEVGDSNDAPGSRWRRMPLFLHVGAVKPRP